MKLNELLEATTEISAATHRILTSFINSKLTIFVVCIFFSAVLRMVHGFCLLFVWAYAMIEHNNIGSQQ